MSRSRYAGWNGDEWVIGVLWSSLDPLIAPKLGDLYRILEASAQVVRSYHKKQKFRRLMGRLMDAFISQFGLGHRPPRGQEKWGRTMADGSRCSQIPNFGIDYGPSAA